MLARRGLKVVEVLPLHRLALYGDVAQVGGGATRFLVPGLQDASGLLDVAREELQHDGLAHLPRPLLVVQLE